MFCSPLYPSGPSIVPGTKSVLKNYLLTDSLTDWVTISSWASPSWSSGGADQIAPLTFFPHCLPSHWQGPKISTILYSSVLRH